MSVNITETFELLFDKNNNVAYKALQELQKESEETDCVYPYMDISLFNLILYNPWKIIIVIYANYIGIGIIKLMRLLINI